MHPLTYDEGTAGFECVGRRGEGTRGPHLTVHESRPRRLLLVEAEAEVGPEAEGRREGHFSPATLHRHFVLPYAMVCPVEGGRGRGGEGKGKETRRALPRGTKRGRLF